MFPLSLNNFASFPQYFVLFVSDENAFFLSIIIIIIIYFLNNSALFPLFL